ncbi:MAG: NUDIX domain-containing protein [Kiritimatiellia bacterium]
MKPYVLAVKAVIVNEQGKTLLLRRSSANTSFVGCWEWPGGKVDPGEDFATALVREMKEEAGLDVEITGLAGAMEFEMPKVHVVLLCMNARITAGQIVLSDEHDAWAWAPLAELKDWQLAPRVDEFMYAYATRGTVT